MVHGEVNTQMAYNITAQLKKLEHLDADKPITMLINSPGGSVIDGLAIIDMMREVKCKIVTVGNGMHASMGSVFLAAGDERRMFENSYLMVHQIMSGNGRGTQHSDIEIGAALTSDLHERLKNVYVEFTGLNHKFWDIVGERDTWFTAEQALKIGFITGIVKPEKPRGPYADEAKREETNLFITAAKEKIAGMGADEVIKLLNNGQANHAEWGRFRPELVVRLAEFPEFWTEKRRQEFAVKSAAKAVANDDNKQPETSRKADAAPKL